jgi:uncharacterized membrane protein
MIYLVAYIATLIVFGIIDAAWLSIMGAMLYRPVLGDILLTNVRVAPAIVFYLLYPIGLVVFAVLPALRAETVIHAIALGALFGAIAYATYDLTNLATLRNWTAQIAVIDIAYGAVTSGLAAAAGYLAVRASSGWLGQASL